MKINLLLANLITLSIGCTGVKFANATVNMEIPEAFTKRALYPAGVAGYDFQDLVGNIVAVKRNLDPKRIGRITPRGYKSIVIPITESYNYYKSRIQKGAEVKSSYLSFAANFSSEDLADLELVDIARSGIKFEEDTVFREILKEVKIWVAKNPNKDTSIKRLWIKAVVLTSKTYSSFTKISSTATGQVGDVVGVATGVYNKSEKSIKSVIMAFEAFDVDELFKQTRNVDTLNTSTQNSFNNIESNAIYIETIDGSMVKIE